MTPQRIAELAEQLGPRGRFARKDPALLSAARELLVWVRAQAPTHACACGVQLPRPTMECGTDGCVGVPF